MTKRTKQGLKAGAWGLAIVVGLYFQLADTKKTNSVTNTPVTKDVAYSVFGVGLSDNIQSVLDKLTKSQAIDSDSGIIGVRAQEVGQGIHETGWLVAALFPDTPLPHGTEVCRVITLRLTLRPPFQYVLLNFVEIPDGKGWLKDVPLSDAAALQALSSKLGALVGIKWSLDSKRALSIPEPVEGNPVYAKLVQMFGAPDDTERGNGSLQGLPWDGRPMAWKNRLILEAKWKSVNEELRYVVYSDIRDVPFELGHRNVALLRKYVDELMARNAAMETSQNKAVESVVSHMAKPEPVAPPAKTPDSKPIAPVPQTTEVTETKTMPVSIATVTGDSVRVRLKPSIDAEVIGKVTKGQKVRVIGRDTSTLQWLKIQSTDGTGEAWIHGDFVHFE